MTNLRIPESEAEGDENAMPAELREADRASGPQMRGKRREKKRYVGLSYTETQHKQLYLAATHRDKSPGDYIWGIIEEHVQADLADLQRDLDEMVG